MSNVSKFRQILLTTNILTQMDALWMASPNSAEEKQGDRSLVGYGGDRLCKRFQNGGVLLFLTFVITYFSELERTQLNIIYAGAHANITAQIRGLSEI
jgi:putative Ca2+/H+ antiporter (TMEM165/GDT1 family)